MATPDQVRIRATTSSQAIGELKVIITSSKKVVWLGRAGGAVSLLPAWLLIGVKSWEKKMERINKTLFTQSCFSEMTDKMWYVSDHLLWLRHDWSKQRPLWRESAAFDECYRACDDLIFRLQQERRLSPAGSIYKHLQVSDYGEISVCFRIKNKNSSLGADVCWECREGGRLALPEAFGGAFSHYNTILMLFPPPSVSLFYYWYLLHAQQTCLLPPFFLIKVHTVWLFTCTLSKGVSDWWGDRRDRSPPKATGLNSTSHWRICSARQI